MEIKLNTIMFAIKQSGLVWSYRKWRRGRNAFPLFRSAFQLFMHEQRQSEQYQFRSLELYNTGGSSRAEGPQLIPIKLEILYSYNIAGTNFK